MQEASLRRRATRRKGIQMISRTPGRTGLLGAALAMSLVVGACQGNAPTQAPADPTPTATPTPAPTDTPTPAPSPTDVPTPTPTPTASPTPTPTPAPTVPASASVCTGGDAVKRWFADQTPLINFDVYCAVLPKGWYLVKAQVDYVKGGIVVEYKNGSGHTLDLYEGTFCHMYPNPCTSYIVPEIGDIPFGSTLMAELSGGSGLWHASVAPSPGVIYATIGEGMTQAQITAYAAAMHNVG
jgi:hypothetical protein